MMGEEGCDKLAKKAIDGIRGELNDKQRVRLLCNSSFGFEAGVKGVIDKHKALPYN